MRSRLAHEFIHTANASPCADLFLEICVIPFLLVLAALQVHHQTVPPFTDPTIQTEFAQSGRKCLRLFQFPQFQTEIAQVGWRL